MTDKNQNPNVTPVSVVDEMKESYAAYSLAVIVGRAIPDLYDGLKPVTRRVMAAMSRLGLRPDGRFMKCARVEGETMGRFHPHGGAYGAMVTASQWWTNNHTLVNIHGNGGSPTDGPAAPRYTESKLTEFAYTVLLQEQDTWETRPNYDNSLQEPVRLNVKVPNVLLNGSEGIAVGMSTRIPTHNLRGVAKALRCWQKGDIKGAAKHLIPDFPTGCDVVKDDNLLEYVKTGKGSIRMRAVCEQIEEDYGKRSTRDAFVFTNLPFHANTEQVGQQIKLAVEAGKITTVADVRDETDMSGIRLVVILKAKVSVEQAKAEIYKHTSLDTKFPANNLVIDGIRPIDVSPYEVLEKWMGWRDERFVVALKEELAARRLRLEIVKGLITTLDQIDDIIYAIRQSTDKAMARAKIVKMGFSEVQANAILDMKLSQLTKLDATTLKAEAKELQARVKELIKLNSSEKLRQEFILNEIDELATRHGNARRSKVVEPPKELSVTVIKQGRKQVKVQGPKPRFVLVDEQKGILTQQKTLTKSAMVVPSDDKLLFVCDNGMFIKVSATAKGPLFSAPTKVLFKQKLSTLPEAALIAVYELGDSVYANVMVWESLTKCTSRGKSWLPEGAKLIHLGNTFTLEMKGRKKDKVIGINTVKPRPIGGKGTKIANLSDTQL
jgi:DNA gyrase subunit A